MRLGVVEREALAQNSVQLVAQFNEQRQILHSEAVRLVELCLEKLGASATGETGLELDALGCERGYVLTEFR